MGLARRVKSPSNARQRQLCVLPQESLASPIYTTVTSSPGGVEETQAASRLSQTTRTSRGGVKSPILQAT